MFGAGATEAGVTQVAAVWESLLLKKLSSGPRVYQPTEEDWDQGPAQATRGLRQQ